MSSVLSDSTKKQHASILNVLEQRTQIDLSTTPITIHPTLYEHIKMIGNPNTRKNYLNAVIRAAEGHSAETLKPYLELRKQTFDFLSKERVSQTLPHHRLENMLKWYDVIELREKAEIKLSSSDYLIYCLYTLNPPVRADYWNMTVVSSVTKKRRADKTQNYCVLHKTGGSFLFNVYKTSEKYGSVEVQMSKDLFKVVSSRVSVGERLLADVNSANALSRRVIRIFEILSGKSMGIGLLRHSCITSYLSQIHRIVDKMEFARQMLHSWTEQEEYHIIE